MDKNNNKVEDERYEFNSVKIAHELMVDILGGLIPGALFLFSIILCVVFPIICYANPGNKFGFLMKDGDWFWIVAFLSFLILSYVIGHIFYRADIKVPDRADIRREQRKKLKAFVYGIPVGKNKKGCNESEGNENTSIENSISCEVDYAAKRMRYAASRLYMEIKPLADALCDYKCNTSHDLYNDDFKKNCDEAIEFLNDILNKPTEVFIKGWNESDSPFKIRLNKFKKNILHVLFPEADCIIDLKDNDASSMDSILKSNFPNNFKKEQYESLAKQLFPQIDQLPFRSRYVLYDTVKIVPLVAQHLGNVGWRLWRRLRFYIRLHSINNNWKIEDWRRCDNIEKEPFNILMVAYLILHMQNESGCATEKRCDFPYMSYYKYLLKRGQFELLRFVKWGTSSARTKNQINKYKIELQLHVPNAYSIISKNESHIRMAASSWHVAKTVRVVSWCMFLLMACFSVLSCKYHSISSKYDDLESVVSNVSMNLVMDHDVSKKDKRDSVNNINKDSEINHHFASDNTLIDVNVKHHFNPKELNVVEQIYSKLDNDDVDVEENNDKKNRIKNDIRFILFVRKFLPFIGGETPVNSYLAVLFPMITLLFMYYIIDTVPRFIHYQRLREIFYTLQVYSLWQDAKKAISRKYLHDLNIRRADVGLSPLGDDSDQPSYF